MFIITYNKYDIIMNHQGKKNKQKTSENELGISALRYLASLSRETLKQIHEKKLNNVLKVICIGNEYSDRIIANLNKNYYDQKLGLRIIKLFDEDVILNYWLDVYTEMNLNEHYLLDVLSKFGHRTIWQLPASVFVKKKNNLNVIREE